MSRYPAHGAWHRSSRLPPATPRPVCPSRARTGHGVAAARRTVAALSILLTACASGAAALALAAAPASGPGTGVPSQAERIVQSVQRHLQEQTASLPGEVRIAVTPLDERTRLAACDDMQVFTAPGARPWGAVSVGVRCLRPQSWQVYVQASVRVLAPVVVAGRAMLAGSKVDAADLTTRVEELTALPASVLQDPNLAIGRVLASNVQAGSVLRAENLKQVLAVVNGQTVRVIYESSTLSVTSDGRALGNAAVGQGVDVRVGSGKTVRGIVRSTGVVVIQ
jgi:flagella basal body P-ring formation protein FlgA